MVAARDEDRGPVASDERLSGTPHTGGYDTQEIAERLREVLPDARILVVIREQTEMIVSAYKQYVRAVGSLSLDDCLHPPVPRKFPTFHPAFLEYDRLIHLYRRLFGSQQVLVLCYESFRRSQRAFLERVHAFTDSPDPLGTLPETPANPAMSALSVGAKRRLNPFVMRDFPNLGRLLYVPWIGSRLERLIPRLDGWIPPRLRRRSEARLRARVAEYVGDRYRASNLRTSELLGVDLAALGYPS